MVGGYGKVGGLTSVSGARWGGLLGLLLWQPPALAERLVLYYEQRSPYTEYREGVLSGLLGKPAMQVLQQLGADMELRDVPFNRHMALIDKNLEYACAIGRYKTEQRRVRGKFSQAFYRDQSYVAIMRGDNARANAFTELQPLLGNAGLRFGFREGYVYGEVLDAWIAASRASLVRLPESNANLVRMVYRHMLDVVLLSGEEAEALLATMPEERAMLTIRRYADSPPGAYRYFYCSRQVDDALLHRLDAAIGTLRLVGPGGANP